MSGAEWLQICGKELSPLGEKVAEILDTMFVGIYHISSEVLKADFSDKQRIRICLRDGRFSTFDSDLLTHLVFLCHERNVRADIKGAAYGYLWLDFVEVTTMGFFAERHPTLPESLERLGIETGRINENDR